MMTTTHRAPTTDADAEVRRAWWSLALFVLSFVAAMVIGEGLAAAMGVAEGEQAPLGTAWLVATPACLVFALPTLVVWWFGHRATQHGRPEGRTPVVVAATLSAAFLGLNLVQLVALAVT